MVRRWRRIFRRRSVGRLVSMEQKWCDGFLSASEMGEITLAVEKAEAGSQGEIVPMIVRSSIRPSYLPLLIQLVFVCLILMSTCVVVAFVGISFIQHRFFLWGILGAILLSFPVSRWMA